MDDNLRPLVFYFEDEPLELKYHLDALQEEYDVLCSASCKDVRIERSRPVALLIVDIMIKRRGQTEGGEYVENAHITGVPWRETGLAVIEGVRDGRYKRFGFARDVPILVASARPELAIETRAWNAGISDYLLKPFRVEELLNAVHRALGEGGEQSDE